MVADRVGMTDALGSAEMSPPTPEAVLEGLTRIVNETAPLAMGWHVVLAGTLLALSLGFRPSCRAAGLVLTAPIASAGAVAWLYTNTFNALVLGVGALALALSACVLPTSRAHSGTTAASVVALSLIGFGWVYPQFLAPGSGLAFLYAAPLGALPCPTLAVVVGFAYFAEGFESRLWSSILGGLGLFYGVVGTMLLGVTSDVVLTIGALMLLGRAWSRFTPFVAKIPSH
jgi:hypothetical protein